MANDEVSFSLAKSALSEIDRLSAEHGITNREVVTQALSLGVTMLTLYGEEGSRLIVETKKGSKTEILPPDFIRRT